MAPAVFRFAPTDAATGFELFGRRCRIFAMKVDKCYPNKDLRYFDLCPCRACNSSTKHRERLFLVSEAVEPIDEEEGHGEEALEHG